MHSSPPRRARARLAALAATALVATSAFAGSASAAAPTADANLAARATTLQTTYVSQDRKLFITVANVRGVPTVGVLWVGMPTFCAGGATPKTVLATTAPLIGSGFESAVVDANGDVKFVQGQISGRTVTGVAKVSYSTTDQGVCSTGTQPFTARAR